MAKRLTIAEQNKFLIELHTRPKGTTKWAVCRRFDISAQRGHHINNQHLSEPELSNQLSQLRNQLLADSLSQAISTEIDNQLRQLQEIPAPRPQPAPAETRDIFLAKAITSEMMAPKKQTQKKTMRFAISISLAAVLVFGVIWFTSNNTHANELEQVRSALKQVEWVRYTREGGKWDGEIYWQRFDPEIFIKQKADGSVMVITQEPPTSKRYDPVTGKADQLGTDHTPESYSRKTASLLELMDNWVLNKFDQATDCEISLEGDTVVYSYQRPKGIYRLILDAESHLPIEYVAPGYRYKYSYPKVVPVEIAKRFGFSSL